MREPTLGELAEDVRDMRAALDRLTDAVGVTYVRQDVHAAEWRAITERVAKGEDRSTWVARTAITALALPILVGIVLVLLLSGGGPT